MLLKHTDKFNLCRSNSEYKKSSAHILDLSFNLWPSVIYDIYVILCHKYTEYNEPKVTVIWDGAMSPAEAYTYTYTIMYIHVWMQMSH